MYMKNQEKAIEIIQKLPRGTKKSISEETGLSFNTVCRFFKGKNTELKTSQLIINKLTQIEVSCNQFF